MIMDDDEFGAIDGKINKEIRSTQRKPAPMPLCPQQTPRDLTVLESEPPRWEAGD
jgi:hypothetical protein